MLERYNYTEKEISELLKSIVVIVDSREKVNTHVTSWLDKKGIQYKIKKLDYGDYSFMLPKNKVLNIDRDMHFGSEFVIERKGSLDEMAGNFTKSRDRIKTEFSQYKGRMILLIEGASYNDILKQKYRSKYNAKSFIGTLHSFYHEYDLPFVFISKECSGMYIYLMMYYFLRDLLKK